MREWYSAKGRVPSSSFFRAGAMSICGMVAGAGTYAIGRAATAYFLEGVSLKDARRTYLRSRKSESGRLTLS